MSDLSDKFGALQVQLGAQHTALMLALAGIDTSIQAATAAVGTMATDIVDRLNPSLDYLSSLDTSITRMRKIMLADAHDIPDITLANGMSSSAQNIQSIREFLLPFGTGRPMPPWGILEYAALIASNSTNALTTLGGPPATADETLYAVLNLALGGPPAEPEYAVLPMLQSLLSSLDGVATNTSPSNLCNIGDPSQFGFDPLIYQTIVWSYGPWIDVGDNMIAPLWPESIESYGVTRGPIMTQLNCSDWTGYGLCMMSTSCMWKWEPGAGVAWQSTSGGILDMPITSGMIEPCVPAIEKTWFGIAVPVGAE